MLFVLIDNALSGEPCSQCFGNFYVAIEFSSDLGFNQHGYTDSLSAVDASEVVASFGCKPCMNSTALDA